MDVFQTTFHPQIQFYPPTKDALSKPSGRLTTRANRHTEKTIALHSQRVLLPKAREGNSHAFERVFQWDFGGLVSRQMGKCVEQFFTVQCVMLKEPNTFARSLITSYLEKLAS